MGGSRQGGRQPRRQHGKGQVAQCPEVFRCAAPPQHRRPFFGKHRLRVADGCRHDRVARRAERLGEPQDRPDPVGLSKDCSLRSAFRCCTSLARKAENRPKRTATEAKNGPAMPMQLAKKGRAGDRCVSHTIPTAIK